MSEDIFLKGFKKGFREFGENISVIVNSVLLFFVYLTGIGLPSVFAKILGKKFLDTKIDREASTYWTDLNLKKRPLEKHLRQF